MADDDIPSCLIFINKEGRWFHRGAEMIRREIIQFFYQHLEIDSEGRYIINWGGDRCHVDVEDKPFIVTRVLFQDSEPSNKSRYILSLSDGTREDLVPESLYVGNGHVLYCRVKGGVFLARFNRVAYYQLAEYIEEKDESFLLPLNGEKYEIRFRDI